MYDVVTGEAVGLELRLARVPSRALALLVDVALQFAAFLAVVLIAARLLSDSDPALSAAVTLVLTVAVIVGYPVAAETLWRGRTLGKLVLGLRVVRDDGGPVRFRQALVRGLLGFFVDIWTTFGLGALLAATLSRRGKRLGDVLAGTVVVRERAPRAGPALPAAPPYLTAWAQTADLSRLRDDDALVARQLLLRSRQLAPAAFDALSRDVASRIAGTVSPPPPPGTPAWPYLAAVLAERRRREEQRLGAAASYAASAPTYRVPPTPPAAPPASDDGFAPPG